MKSEYAQAGVDYSRIEPFKRAMVEVGRRTLKFPNTRGVYVDEESLGAHGVVYEYRGPLSHIAWCKTPEGLGNKNWIAEWMYRNAGTGRTYYDGIGIDTIMMAANDNICQGALPVVYADEVAAGDSEWFQDEQRAYDLAESFFEGCKLCGMALPAGESPSLRYLVKAELPVKSAPVLSGTVTGIIVPSERRITGKRLTIGDHIIGVASWGLHANGISLVIRRAMTLKEKFLQILPNGRILGEEALVPTRCYVPLVEALLKKDIDIHALLPGTGGGVSKIAFDKRPMTYRIQRWVEPPTIFQFMRSSGVTLEDCLTTFNWGIGFYIFVPEKEVNRVFEVGRACNYELMHLGMVEEGDRKVIFEPKNLTLYPES